MKGEQMSTTTRRSYIRWTTPEGAKDVPRASIASGATQEVLDKVLANEREMVRRQHGDELAETVKLDPVKFNV